MSREGLRAARCGVTLKYIVFDFGHYGRTVRSILEYLDPFEMEIHTSLAVAILKYTDGYRPTSYVSQFLSSLFHLLWLKVGRG